MKSLPEIIAANAGRTPDVTDVITLPRRSLDQAVEGLKIARASLQDILEHGILPQRQRRNAENDLGSIEHALAVAERALVAPRPVGVDLAHTDKLTRPDHGVVAIAKPASSVEEARKLVEEFEKAYGPAHHSVLKETNTNLESKIETLKLYCSSGDGDRVILRRNPDGFTTISYPTGKDKGDYQSFELPLETMQSMYETTGADLDSYNIPLPGSDRARMQERLDGKEKQVAVIDGGGPNAFVNLSRSNLQALRAFLSQAIEDTIKKTD